MPENESDKAGSPTTIARHSRDSPQATTEPVGGTLAGMGAVGHRTASSQTKIAKAGANEAAVDILRAGSNAHILETAYSIAQLHAEHHRSATPHERTIHRTTGILGKPWFILF